MIYNYRVLYIDFTKKSIFNIKNNNKDKNSNNVSN